MTDPIRAKNYSEFADFWRKGVPCYYTGWKCIKCDGNNVILERGGKSNILIGERVGENLVVYNHRPKDYATELMKWYNWTVRRCPNLKYVTYGKPKGITHDSWLTNQFYDGLLTVATHLLHPNESLEDLMRS